MINQRMCVVCRTRKQKAELIRISSLNNEAVLDRHKQQTSRAIYVCKNEQCVNILKKSNAIKRFLKVSASEELYKNMLK